VTERGERAQPRIQPRVQTRQRSAVWAALEGAGEFQSAQQLHARLRADGDGVGLATVYRSLQQLVDDGDVDVLRTADGEAVYRRCSTGRHHHHLVCRSCGRTVELDAAAVERWARRMGEEHGFSDVEHVVELFGTCRECSATHRHN
jgi:Fur family ferric uptake transcriptional regulator